VAAGLSWPGTPLLFTPWPGEPIPLLRDPASGKAGHPVQIVTDDPPWWDAFARTYPDSTWFRWAYVPRSYESVVNENLYAYSLAFRELVSPPPSRSEEFHSAPGADPYRYTNQPGVMLTFPIGRLFTVDRPELLEEYRSGAGLTVIRHFPLNEDNPEDHGQKGPFGGEVGYTCVDVDRAGALALLQEARAVANGDPVNIGYLCGSGYSTGFPGYVRRFNQAWLAVPALPSVRLKEASTEPEVIVRRVHAGNHGDYFIVVNTSMRSKRQVELRLPVKGRLRDLVEDCEVPGSLFRTSFYSGELRSYHAAGSN
jgi:hypothetical protein